MNQSPIRKRWREVDGVLLLDKPGGLSSNDALQKARRLYSAAKAGHTGTLDPMATGLLPVCFGEATKFSNRLLEADKTYEAVMRLGQTTRTGDAEGEILRERAVDVSDPVLTALAARFLGEQAQLPPMYSALKHQGRALYEYAREGLEIPREARQITVFALEIAGRRENDVTFIVRCSKGTYVRTLAEDMGEALGCGAHLVALRRTGIGDLCVRDAHTLESLGVLDEPARVPLLASADALLAHLPAVTLDDRAERGILYGQPVRAETALAGEVRLYGPAGNFLGLAAADGHGAIKPLRLLASKLP